MTMASGKIIQTNNSLAKTQKLFGEVTTDKPSAARNQPASLLLRNQSLQFCVEKLRHVNLNPSPHALLIHQVQVDAIDPMTAKGAISRAASVPSSVFVVNLPTSNPATKMTRTPLPIKAELSFAQHR